MSKTTHVRSLYRIPSEQHAPRSWPKVWRDSAALLTLFASLQAAVVFAQVPNNHLAAIGSTVAEALTVGSFPKLRRRWIWGQRAGLLASCFYRRVIDQHGRRDHRVRNIAEAV